MKTITFLLFIACTSSLFAQTKKELEAEIIRLKNSEKTHEFEKEKLKIDHEKQTQQHMVLQKVQLQTIEKLKAENKALELELINLNRENGYFHQACEEYRLKHKNCSVTKKEKPRMPVQEVIIEDVPPVQEEDNSIESIEDLNKNN